MSDEPYCDPPDYATDRWLYEKQSNKHKEPEQVSSFLSAVTHGKSPKPPRIVLYGTEGIGKSTWAASAPKPIFIQTEDGLDGIDVAKFPLCQTIEDVGMQLAELWTDQDHDFQTVVLDSLDWMEQLAWRKVCQEAGTDSIEKVGGGFGKGERRAVPLMQGILSQLNVLRERGMIVICIAHAGIERMEDPESAPYTRTAPRLHKYVAPIVCEWADAVLFAGRKMRVKTEDAGFNRQRGTAVAVGKGGGERYLRTVGTPAILAKNRYALPEELPMRVEATNDNPGMTGWEVFLSAMQSE
jgi:hypothetical protein